MKILFELPPNYSDIIKAIPGVEEAMGAAIFTYYPNIYYPSGGHLPPYKIVHEMEHLNQQARMGVKDWWTVYLADSLFRIKQEIPAYRADYKSFCRHYKDRNEQARYLQNIVDDLSGAGYGSVMLPEEARAAILA